MNLSPKIVKILEDMDVESVHWYNIGAPDAKDAEILKHAIENNFIVLTCDLDFSTILSITHGQKPSIIQLRTQAFDQDEIAKIVAYTSMQNKDALEKGAILTIDAKKSRVRLLPL